MAQFIDRRPNGKNKSAVNRQRFLHRFRNQIKKAVSNAIARRHITDIENGEKIIIPAKDTQEPIFRHGAGGIEEVVHPGNIDFVTGDRIKKPAGAGEAGGSEASNTGEGTDNFQFEISKEEFLNMFFEDLELPDLIKKQLKQIPTDKIVRAGFRTYGSPMNLNVIRSFKKAAGRKIALGGPYKQRLIEAESELADIEKNASDDNPDAIELRKEISFLKGRLHAIPFIETYDLRYNNYIKLPSPSSQAVMFCIMDVSGSMDEVKKDIAKRFFILLYLFLKRNYKKIDLIFIRHHTTAKEVDEDEFFYSRETGGTVVSSALELMKNIIIERYPPTEWNIYGAQASDGDNWNADSPTCQELLFEGIMPYVQYFAYVEIKPRQHQSLWEAYLNVKSAYPNFSMEDINTATDIYPVFHELFKRQTS